MRKRRRPGGSSPPGLLASPNPISLESGIHLRDERGDRPPSIAAPSASALAEDAYPFGSNHVALGTRRPATSRPLIHPPVDRRPIPSMTLKLLRRSGFGKRNREGLLQGPFHPVAILQPYGGPAAHTGRRMAASGHGWAARVVSGRMPQTTGIGGRAVVSAGRRWDRASWRSRRRMTGSPGETRVFKERFNDEGDLLVLRKEPNGTR